MTLQQPALAQSDILNQSGGGVHTSGIPYFMVINDEIIVEQTPIMPDASLTYLKYGKNTTALNTSRLSMARRRIDRNKKTGTKLALSGAFLTAVCLAGVIALTAQEKRATENAMNNPEVIAAAHIRAWGDARNTVENNLRLSVQSFKPGPPQYAEATNGDVEKLRPQFQEQALKKEAQKTHYWVGATLTMDFATLLSGGFSFISLLNLGRDILRSRRVKILTEKNTIADELFKAAIDQQQGVAPPQIGPNAAI